MELHLFLPPFDPSNPTNKTQHIINMCTLLSMIDYISRFYFRVPVYTQSFQS